MVQCATCCGQIRTNDVGGVCHLVVQVSRDLGAFLRRKTVSL